MFRSLRFIAAWLGVTGVAWGQVAEVDRIFARYQKLRPSDAELSMYRLDWAASYEVAMRRAAHEGRAIFLVIDGFPQSSPGLRESLSEYTARELTKGLLRLRSEERATRTNALILPDLSEDRGIRVFVSLLDDRMRAYRAPVVEVVPLAPADWKLLAWPPQKRRVNAAELAKWLSQVYPPGVMERTDPRTKVAYRIESVEGNLSLAPAGQDEKVRYAILSGNIRLTDEGQDDFGYTGKLDIVLTYHPDQTEPESLRGVFEGSYPRLDRMLNRSRDLPLQAVFESRPN